MNIKRENKPGRSFQSDSLISLYSRIPDYSEVQHLGNSDFIKTLEQLKEEFRQCRASLYTEDSDVDYISDKAAKVLNIGSSTPPEHESHYNNTLASFVSNRNNLLGGQNNDRSYLSISSCALHRSPYNGNTSYLNKSNRSLTFKSESKNDSAFHDDFLDLDSGASTPDSCVSRWSSNPEISFRRKEFAPPSNIEQRLLIRKPMNKSAPSLPNDDEPGPMFRANPVPSHVHKPLFDLIMLKNKRRSQRVKEESKQRLLAQVKPFSFTKDSKTSHFSGGTHGGYEILNNTKPQKIRKLASTGQNVKTNNNKFSSSQSLFKANPAPPRTRALLSAIRLKEQQDYRELKKRLRSEALMKSASLPPSMAARDRRTKINNAKIDAILRDYCSSSTPRIRDKNHKRQRRPDSSADDTYYTDDDRMTEDSYSHSKGTNAAGTKSEPKKRVRNFTPFGISRHSAAADGVFESTSNDNHASRLRVQTAKMKEEERIKQEEEELMRSMKVERRRKILRDAHLQAWRRACSYSACQDIAMRRQLRMAASILERESFRKDMSSMLSRVRSAPLLLEGERQFGPCKRHHGEACQRAYDRRLYKTSGATPRVNLPYYASRENFTAIMARDDERSETAAVADGNLTNSDNESVKNALDSDDEKDKDDKNEGANEQDVDDEEIPEEFEDDNENALDNE